MKNGILTVLFCLSAGLGSLAISFALPQRSEWTLPIFQGLWFWVGSVGAVVAALVRPSVVWIVAVPVLTLAAISVFGAFWWDAYWPGRLLIPNIGALIVLNAVWWLMAIWVGWRALAWRSAEERRAFLTVVSRGWSGLRDEAGKRACNIVKGFSAAVVLLLVTWHAVRFVDRTIANAVYAATWYAPTVIEQSRVVATGAIRPGGRTVRRFLRYWELSFPHRPPPWRVLITDMGDRTRSESVVDPNRARGNNCWSSQSVQTGDVVVLSARRSWFGLALDHVMDIQRDGTSVCGN